MVKAVLDLDYEEDSAAEPTRIRHDREGSLVEVQATAEAAVFTRCSAARFDRACQNRNHKACGVAKRRDRVTI